MRAAPGLVLGAVLVLSGALKLRPGGADQATRFLRALGWRPFPGAVVAAAVVEILLGTALLVATGRGAVLGAVAATAFLGLMTALVALALSRGVATGCGCAGSPGPALTWRTLARNLVLLALGGAAVAGAVAGHAPTIGPWARVTVLVGVLVGVALACVVAWHRGARKSRDAARDAARDVGLPGVAEQPGPEDYLRAPIPDVALWRAVTAVPLRELIAGGPRLLVFAETSAGVPAELVALRTLAALAPVRPTMVVPGDALTEPGTYRDPGWVVLRALGVGALPAAVLLGADGWIAGGPVYGSSAIVGFAGEVEQALAEAPR